MGGCDAFDVGAGVLLFVMSLHGDKRGREHVQHTEVTIIETTGGWQSGEWRRTGLARSGKRAVDHVRRKRLGGI